MNYHAFTGKDILALALALVPVACGTTPSSENSTASSLESTWYGVDSENAPCSFTLALGPTGTVEVLQLTGTFVSDYKIPTPLSGLYGIYRTPAQLDQDNNMSEKQADLSRSWLRDADVIKGRGKPVLWDQPFHDHKLVIKPHSQKPESVEYSAHQRLAGVLPFVDMSLKCTFTSAP